MYDICHLRRFLSVVKTFSLNYYFYLMFIDQANKGNGM